VAVAPHNGVFARQISTFCFHSELALDRFEDGDATGAAASPGSLDAQRKLRRVGAVDLLERAFNRQALWTRSASCAGFCVRRLRRAAII
jgi:hypothetical protein